MTSLPNPQNVFLRATLKDRSAVAMEPQNLNPTDFAIPDAFNLASYVLAGNGACADKCAVRVVGSEDLAYGELRRRVVQTAAALQDAGVTAGQRVMLRVGNTVDFPVLYLATIWSGAIAVVTSPQLTAREIDVLCETARPDWIVSDGGSTTGSASVAVIRAQDLEHSPASTVAPILGDPNRPAYVVFTSGTSGTPKAVVHAHRAIWARRMMWSDWYDLKPDDIMYHAGAFNWTFTLGTGLLDPWAIGATAIIAPDRRPDWKLLSDHSVTLFAAAPGVFRKLLQTRPDVPTSLRHGLTAGDRLSPKLRDAWRLETGTPMLEAFGMTECSTFLSDRPSHPPGLRPQRGRQVRLETDGRMAVHGSDAGLMLGYMSGGTLVPRTGDWFVTGDVFQLNNAGRYEFLARDSAMLNAGGFRISPLEIEDVLTGFEGIEDVAVTEISVKDNVTIVAAFYMSQSVIDDRTLEVFAARNLARYKQPRIYQKVDALPRNPNGKLLRRELPNLWRP